MCGELAGRPVEALALLAIGMTRLSMGAVLDRADQGNGPGARTQADPAGGHRRALDDVDNGSRIRELLTRACAPAEASPIAGLHRRFRHRVRPWPAFPRTSSTRSKRASRWSRRRCRPVPRPEEFVRLSKEYAELEPIVRPIQAYRKAVADLPARRRSARSPATRKWPRWPRPRSASSKPRIEALVEDIRILLLPKDAADDERSSSSKSAPAPAATRRPCSPATCFACISAMPTCRAGRSCWYRKSRGRGRRLQGSDRQHLRHRASMPG